MPQLDLFVGRDPDRVEIKWYCTETGRAWDCQFCQKSNGHFDCLPYNRKADYKQIVSSEMLCNWCKTKYKVIPGDVIDLRIGASQYDDIIFGFKIIEGPDIMAIL